MSSILISNLSVSGANAANDIGAASGDSTGDKLVALIDATAYKVPTDTEAEKLKNVTVSGLDFIDDGATYKKTTTAGANDANSIATTSGTTLANRIMTLINASTLTLDGGTF